MKNKLERLNFRKKSVFKRIQPKDIERLRVFVKRTLNNTYASIIDDINSKTITTVSTLNPELKDKIKNSGNVAAAKEVGILLATKLKEKNISKIYFDRGGRKYHGRVKAVATGLRENGILF